MTTRQVLSAAACALALAACASAQRDELPPVPPDVPVEWLHFTEPAARVGDPAPDFELPTQDDARRVSLSSLRGRPVVLIFGSHT